MILIVALTSVPLLPGTEHYTPSGPTGTLLLAIFTLMPTALV